MSSFSYDATCGRELLPVSHIFIIIIIIIITINLSIYKSGMMPPVEESYYINTIIIIIMIAIITINPSISKSGMMPPVEESYWLLPSGPTWLWWLLAILPLDSHAQVKTEQKQKTPMLDMC